MLIESFSTSPLFSIRTRGNDKETSFVCRIPSSPRIRLGLWVFIFLTVPMAGPSPALALQAHTASEGLVVHQVAHCFFLLSMGFLAYWLRERGLTNEPGWRCVRIAAFFFILWNINAFLAHTIEDRGELYRAINRGDWNEWVSLPPLSQGESFLVFLFYLAELDHLLALPGIVFLAIGLHRLLRRENRKPSSGVSGSETS